MSKKRIFSLGAGLSLFSALALPPKVQAAIETEDEATGFQGIDELINVLQQVPGSNEMRLTSTATAVLTKAIENSDKWLLQDGVFTLTPSGEVKMIMKKSDLEKLKVEFFKLKMELINANNTVPTSGA